MEQESIREINKRRYDILWKQYGIADPKFWPQWEVIKKYQGKQCLEIGPGTKPKIPLAGGYFLDISQFAVERLNAGKGHAAVSDLSKVFPYKNRMFDLVCAFEVLEHIPGDKFAVNEIARVLKKSGIFFLSVPLHMRLINQYDRYVGHVRRYDPKEIYNLLTNSGFSLIEYTGLSVLWPGKFSAIAVTVLSEHFQNVFTKIGQLIDNRQKSTLRKPISMKPWGKQAFLELEKANTGVFIARL